ncbi:hypothetical protein SPONN_381 [uncultured Candidatus Thioglobus sp.]|nr:hypothetical protein SPONL_265 [uncultured Candidatus Thioglobus sp.]SMM99207.1 hypothetical protein SPONN_381 [uncultured Candidatus Thioglobus sp.]
MKLNYYKDTDSLYIDLSLTKSVESQEVSNGVVIDYDNAGNITGIDIENASTILDLKELTMSHLPLQKQTISA